MNIFTILPLISLFGGGLISVLVAGYAAVVKDRHGVLSLRSFAALSLLVFGVGLFYFGVFVFAGGPDGNPLSLKLFGMGVLVMAAVFAAILFALRLLLVPMKWAAIFLVPTVLTVAIKVIDDAFYAANSNLYRKGVWGIVESLFSGAVTFGPLLCLVVIIIIWARRELKES
ncbi:MAG: hypothetical protein LBI48_07395 [Burkholderiaceae bacterium]|jgi:hypothetical protein|nr:hypothetical protein [Burkholderiaceae bacterium]